MDITGFFLRLALGGAGWVLWLLVGLSVVSVAVMLERWLYFRGKRCDVTALAHRLEHGDAAALKQVSVDFGNRSVAGAVATAGVAAWSRGRVAAGEAMNAERARQRRLGERFLMVLGTLGSNVPYVGLFGTVLGVIEAFDELKGGAESSSLVMSGIADALVATAVGLMVAVPAVAAYNAFNRRLRTLLSEADQCAHALLARDPGTGGASVE